MKYLLSIIIFCIGTVNAQTNCGTYPKDYVPKDIVEAVTYLSFTYAHASHYMRAGDQYWLDFIRATTRSHPNSQCGGGYGCGFNPDDGNVAIGESWAEFLGTNYAVRHHPTGEKSSRWQRSLTPDNAFIQNSVSLEFERWFFNDWISSGIYNDLNDTVNTNITENWDVIGGLTIKQLFEFLGPNVDNFCDYEEQILLNTNFSRHNVDLIFMNNGAPICR